MMRHAPVWLALAALPFLLGNSCEPTPVAPPGTTLGLELAEVVPQPTGYFLQLELWVDTDQPVQAIDVEIEWQGEEEVAIRPLSSPGFDDDDQVLGGPLPMLVEDPPFRFADLRHGDTALTGTMGLASIFVRALDGGDAEVTARVTLARPDGSVFPAGSATLSFSESQLPPPP